MVPQPFLELQPPAHNPPRVIILRQDQILIAPHARQPAVVRRVMVPQRPRPHALPADIDFPDFPPGLLIVPLADRPPPYPIPTEGLPKPTMGRLRQHGKIEPAPVVLHLVLQVLALPMQPRGDLRRPPPPSSPRGRERPGGPLAQPLPAELIQPGAFEPQERTGLALRHPVIVERLQGLHDQCLGQSLVQLLAHSSPPVSPEGTAPHPYPSTFEGYKRLLLTVP